MRHRRVGAGAGLGFWHGFSAGVASPAVDSTRSTFERPLQRLRVGCDGCSVSAFVWVWLADTVAPVESICGQSCCQCHRLERCSEHNIWQRRQCRRYVAAWRLRWSRQSRLISYGTWQLVSVTSRFGALCLSFAPIVVAIVRLAEPWVAGWVHRDAPSAGRSLLWWCIRPELDGLGACWPELAGCRLGLCASAVAGAQVATYRGWCALNQANVACWSQPRPFSEERANAGASGFLVALVVTTDTEVGRYPATLGTVLHACDRQGSHLVTSPGRALRHRAFPVFTSIMWHVSGATRGKCDLQVLSCRFGLTGGVWCCSFVDSFRYLCTGNNASGGVDWAVAGTGHGRIGDDLSGSEGSESACRARCWCSSWAACSDPSMREEVVAIARPRCARGRDDVCISATRTASGCIRGDPRIGTNTTARDCPCCTSRGIGSGDMQWCSDTAAHVPWLWDANAGTRGTGPLVSAYAEPEVQLFARSSALPLSTARFPISFSAAR